MAGITRVDIGAETCVGGKKISRLRQKHPVGDNSAP
jgi:hypothetical protein